MFRKEKIFFNLYSVGLFETLQQRYVGLFRIILPDSLGNLETNKTCGALFFTWSWTRHHTIQNTPPYVLLALIRTALRWIHRNIFFAFQKLGRVVYHEFPIKRLSNYAKSEFSYSAQLFHFYDTSRLSYFPIGSFQYRHYWLLSWYSWLEFFVFNKINGFLSKETICTTILPFIGSYWLLFYWLFTLIYLNILYVMRSQHFSGEIQDKCGMHSKYGT